MAVPIGKRALQNHRARLVASDLRTFSAAFQRYAKEHGDWPTGGRPAGKIPNGMGLYLLGTHWADVTPIGGHYQWCRNSPQSGGRYTAVIVIASSEGTAPSNRSDQLRMLEEAVDRDTASAGNLFLGYRNFPVYVLEH